MGARLMAWAGYAGLACTMIFVLGGTFDQNPLMVLAAAFVAAICAVLIWAFDADPY